ncbi:hypothetical protein [Zooshikella harenae]|uniref:Uncharacterized protein n=1 Tax=Zooshikella harenae TaxID=2827238 RepID=A0ABS5ZLW4_9GAMM|nr:hypothetical protein [Zooshikella harenae]MBU2714511.1 hypothetical protein [Zooshikella harenae]
MNRFLKLYTFNIILGVITALLTSKVFINEVSEHHPLYWVPMAFFSLHAYWFFGVIGYFIVLIAAPISMQLAIEDMFWFLVFYSPVLGALSIFIYLKKGNPHPLFIKSTPYLFTFLMNITFVLNAYTE